MKIIYIAGAGRSGSTLLSALLSQHSGVFNLGQFRDFFRAYDANQLCSCEARLQSCSFWSRVTGQYIDAYGEDNFRKIPSLMSAFFSDALKIDDWSVTDATRSLAYKHKIFLEQLRQMLTLIENTSGVHALVDFSKSPELALAFSLLDGVELRLVNLVRDPRAVLTSWHKKRGNQAVVNQTAIWADRQNRLNKWSAILGDAFVRIRYEDFTASPQAIIETLFSWAALGSAPELFMSSTRARISWQKLHLYPPANETFLAKRESEVDIAEARSWDSPENRNLHAYVVSRLKNEMHSYGYSVEADTTGPGTEAEAEAEAEKNNRTKGLGKESMKKRNFVFLICSERSGSNLINSMMKCHSQVSAPPPYHLFRDIGLNFHQIIGNPADNSIREKLLNSVAGRLVEYHSPEAKDRFLTWQATQKNLRFEDILDFVYNEHDHNPSASTMFIKENNLDQTLFIILHYFPNAKFVFQVRDPRDYLVSALERKDFWLGNKFGSNLRAMEIWRANQLAGLQALAHLGPDRVFVQRYEDLVSQPEKVIPALCNFLKLPYEEGMLDFHQSQEVARLAKPGGPRENLAKPLMSDNFGKYRDKLTREQIAMVEAYLGDLMARFGYERDLPGEEITLNAILIPQLSEALERYINGERAPFYKDGQPSGLGINTNSLRLPYNKLTLS